jgi:hypothetical protein
MEAVMSTACEPRNPLYLLLLLVSLLFVITALAYAFVPVLEGMAVDTGGEIHHSAIRDSLVNHGWLWLLGEVVAMVILGILSMGYDRLRTLQKERAGRTIPPSQPTDRPNPS